GLCAAHTYRQLSRLHHPVRRLRRPIRRESHRNAIRSPRAERRKKQCTGLLSHHRQTQRHSWQAAGEIEAARLARTAKTCQEARSEGERRTPHVTQPRSSRDAACRSARSEERRVGKECGSRWAQDEVKKKT